MSRQPLLVCLCVLATACGTLADDYRVEVMDTPAPADELVPEIVEQLAPTGVRVIRQPSRVVWELWPCESWELQADFEASFEVLYPFQPGQLMGVLRLPRRGSDFREQTIDRGVYTLRYAQQPVDGNHVGTSPTRDFFLMVRADADTSAAKLDAEQLSALSAEAAESTHPAMLSLQPRQGDGDAEVPSIYHKEDRDWWILRFAGKASGTETRDVVVKVVAVGHAEE